MKKFCTHEILANFQIKSPHYNGGVETMSQAHEAYETFEKFAQPSGMSLSDVIKFEQLYFKAKSFHMEILDGVLAYRLLNSANLTNVQKQLVKATLSKTDYQIMKDQLKKVFTSLQEIRITDSIIVEITKTLKIKTTIKK